MTVVENIDVVMGAKTADLDRAIAKEVKALRQLEKESNAISSRRSGGETGVLGGDIKNTLAQYAGAAAVFQGLKASLSLAATAESNKISLEVLSGSVEKATRLYQGFIDLDRSSPLSRQDFSKAAQTLIGYGFAADSTIPALKQLSEISVGNADRFQSLSLAFGQVTANGRLMGQEVLQMVNAGFNPLQEISRTTGRSMIELKKAMEAGAISASMVEDALQSATAEGGRFYEMNERLKNSAAGQFAKMKSDVELLATEIGTNLLPSAKAFM
jgi:tape measure domain-containing protein